jgi:hypothetical protein
MLPEDTSALVAAERAALRKDGDEADLWLAYALSTVGAADVDALRAAAAANQGPHAAWILPIVVLRVAEAQGALDDAAAEVARDLADDHADPHRLIALMMAMGAPMALLAAPQDEIDNAIAFGAACADQEVRATKIPPGSKKRRQQHAVRALLDGVPGPMAALLRAVNTRDPRPEWGLWPLSIAAWLEASTRAPDTDVVERVLLRSAGGDARTLSEARRAANLDDAPDLLFALDHDVELAAGILAVQVFRATGDVELAEAVLDLHSGDVDEDIRTVALSIVAAFQLPDRVPELLVSQHADDRTLGLVFAEWVPTTEVLEALLAMPVPADPTLRAQYAQCLAAMGDAAIVPTLTSLVAQDEHGDYAEARALAEELLHVAIG